MRTIVRTATATLVAATTLAAAWGAQAPASAETRVLHDKVGDSRTGSGDIRAVRIGHWPRKLAVRVLPVRRSGLAHFYDIWIDTDPHNPGPERVIPAGLEVSPATRVLRTDRFGQFGRPVCRLPHGSGYDTSAQEFWVVVPRACLGRPARVRVSVHSSEEFGPSDWAPRFPRFSPWVARG